MDYTCDIFPTITCPLVINEGIHRFSSGTRVHKVDIGPFGYLYAMQKNSKTIHVLEVIKHANSEFVNILRVNVLNFEEEIIDMSVSPQSDKIITFSSKNSIIVSSIRSAYVIDKLKTLPLYEMKDSLFKYDDVSHRVLYQRLDEVLCVFMQAPHFNGIHILVYYLNTTGHNSLATNMTVREQTLHKGDSYFL